MKEANLRTQKPSAKYPGAYVLAAPGTAPPVPHPFSQTTSLRWIPRPPGPPPEVFRRTSVACSALFRRHVFSAFACRAAPRIATHPFEDPIKGEPNPRGLFWEKKHWMGELLERTCSPKQQRTCEKRTHTSIKGIKASNCECDPSGLEDSR